MIAILKNLSTKRRQSSTDQKAICESKIVQNKAKQWKVLRIIALAASQFFFALLLAEVVLPGARSLVSPAAFIVCIVIAEIIFLASIIRKPDNLSANSCILMIIWTILITWETCSTKLGFSNPVLFPTPEAVFNVFPTQWYVLLDNMLASGSLLLMGAATAIFAGVVLGSICGWVRPLQTVFAPIARVLAPIPSVVFAPYIILLTPTFRIASATIIFLGIFWPTFLNVIIRVQSMDKRIVENARMLNLSSIQMVKDVILPYLLPGVINGLNGQLTAAVTMLTFAEMLGAKAGLGYYIINYTNFANYVNVIAGIICVAVLVTILNWLINRLKAYVVKWN